jgi:hypothetical protein
MFLLLLRKNKNWLGICYRAGLRAQVSITKLTEKHKHKTKITQIVKKGILIKQHNINVTTV